VEGLNKYQITVAVHQIIKIKYKEGKFFKFKFQLRRIRYEYKMSEQKMFNTDKLKIDIYVPLDSCACMWDQFINNIFSVLTPYIKQINFDTKNINSNEARQLKIFSNCVIVDGKKKIMSADDLKQQLPTLLKEKGLI